MEPYTLARKLRSLSREERQLKAVEREHLRVMREVTGVLETSKRRLERRLDWLNDLAASLTEEGQTLTALQTEFNKLLNETMERGAAAKNQVETESQAIKQELQQMEEQAATEAAADHIPGPDEPQKFKVFVRSLTETTPEETPASQVRVQLYHPGQNGFSS